MKLNVGSGKRYEPDYCNIDLYDGILADQKISATNLPFPDNSCEEVKAIQFIEHIGFFEALYVLSEFFRVLQSNGILIIETPDIGKAFQSYLNGNYEQQKEILGWIFGIPHEGLQHKLCYPSKLLTEMLIKIGFIDINENKYYNPELIPTLRIECKKPLKVNLFQIITHIRKQILLENIVDFKESFLTKEQEDLITFILLKLREFEEEKDKIILNEIFKTLLVTFPQLAKIFLKTIEDFNYLTSLEVKYFNEIIGYIIEYNLPNILLKSLKKLPKIPGTQMLAFSSIKSFGETIIEKLLFFSNEKKSQLARLKELSTNNTSNELFFFSFTMIQRKSQDYFYQGIKEFYKQNYEIAKEKLLGSIQLFRDDFIYYWNLAKVLIKLNLKSDALKFYKRTLRLLKISKIKNKKTIRKDITSEISYIKKPTEKLVNFNPILNLDKYHSVN
ncbi:MAG: methyltransferase domain-containing protein [Promethearchaeota archaeon]